MKHFLFFIALLCLLPAPDASARRHNGKVDASGGTITAVSEGSISVKNSKSNQSYMINSATVIHVNALRATAADLKKGMHADVTGSLIDPSIAVLIEASSGS